MKHLRLLACIMLLAGAIAVGMGRCDRTSFKQTITISVDEEVEDGNTG